MDARDWDLRWLDKLLHAHGEPSSVVLAASTVSHPARRSTSAVATAVRAVACRARMARDCVDFSTEALRQARERSAASGIEVDWVEADLTDYEPERHAFDLVLVAHLHVPGNERGAILAKACRCSRRRRHAAAGRPRPRQHRHGSARPTSPAVLYTPADIGPSYRSSRSNGRNRSRRPMELADGREVEAIDALVLATRR